MHTRDSKPAVCSDDSSLDCRTDTQEMNHCAPVKEIVKQNIVCSLLSSFRSPSEIMIKGQKTPKQQQQRAGVKRLKSRLRRQLSSC